MSKTELEEPITGQTGSRIPEFSTIEEEAAFWDAHSTTEFENEFAEVADVAFVVSTAAPKKGITVRLEADVVAKLRREARAKGVGLSTLVRMWILERLRGTPGEP